MDKTELKFLKFRNDLINLLKEYNFEMSGTILDDGSMNIEDLRNQKIYILKDSNSDYEALDVDRNTLPFNYISELFPERILYNHTIMRVGIFSNNYAKVSNLFNTINEINKNNIKVFKDSLEQKEIILTNGINYIWIPVKESSRGYKCSRAYIDKNLTLDELQNIVVPICSYCTKQTVIVF